MPYAQDFSGIYRIVNKVKGDCYVGQSQYMKKRIREHFRLLAKGKHSNPRLQNAYDKYGQDSFVAEIEAVISDFSDMDMVENAFISGDAKFDTPVVYNIADFAKAPMRGRFHSEETRRKIREGRAKSKFDPNSPSWRAALRAGQLRRFMEDPDFVRKVKFILDNNHLTYAERARRINSDTGSVRKLYLRYRNMKDLFP